MLHETNNANNSFQVFHSGNKTTLSKCKQEVKMVTSATLTAILSIRLSSEMERKVGILVWKLRKDPHRLSWMNRGYLNSGNILSTRWQHQFKPFVCVAFGRNSIKMFGF